MTDAKALWWPPLQRFYDFLVELNARDAGGDAKEIEVRKNILITHMQTALNAASEKCAGLQDRLKEYHEVLLRGVGFFRPPSPSSRRVVESEKSLAIGKKRIPVEPALRSLALELSGYLVSHEPATMQVLISPMSCSVPTPGHLPCQACLHMHPYA